LESEKIEEYRIGQTHHLNALVRKVVRWTTDNADAIAAANPAMPPTVINRSSDLWRVMLSIATVAGGDWPGRIEQAIVASLRRGDDDSEQLEKLLADIKVVFAEKGDEISSTAMADELVGMLGRPWAEMGKYRKPLTAAKLARMLQVPGVSVSPRKIKGGTARGYVAEDFHDIFARYLPTSRPSLAPYYPPSKCPSVLNPMKTEGTDISQSVSEVSDGHIEVSEVPGTDTLEVSTDTSKDASESVLSPMEIGVSDTRTLPRGVEGPPLPGMLEPARVRQLVDWYRKRTKALRAEMSPATLEVHLKQKLRETLAEELVADLVDDTASKIAKAAKPKASKTKRAKS
jgi:hypothetical protein